MGRGSGLLLLVSALGGASVLAACLLPTFSDVLPEATTPVADSGADAELDADVVAPVGCDEPLSPGAFAFWPMTEGAGNVVHDCSGNYPGTFGSGVAWTSGRNGQQALAFSGGFVALVDDEALRIAGPFTVTAWINASNLQVDAFGDIIARYASINTAAFDVTVTKDPNVALTLFSGTNITQAVGPLTYGVFKHIAATYAPGTGNAELFIDGQSVQSTVGPTSLPPLPTPMTFGANSVGTSAYFGKIAGLRIYTRVLTPSEIVQLSKL